MAEDILLCGDSGSGKSTSLQNLPSENTLLINTIGKRLPFRSSFKYFINTDDVEKMKRTMMKCPDHVKIIVIDDAGYIMTNQFMRGHSGDKSGGNTFDLFNNIADSFWGLINFTKQLPEDKTVYFIMHVDTNDFGQKRPKTIGKLLSEKVCIEGMFTVVLRSEVMGDKYCFVTQNEGNDFCKSPIGMFTEKRIPNDLKAVDDIIREYWGLTPITESKGDNQ